MHSQRLSYTTDTYSRCPRQTQVSVSNPLIALKVYQCIIFVTPVALYQTGKERSSNTASGLSPLGRRGALQRLCALLQRTRPHPHQSAHVQNSEVPSTQQSSLRVKVRSYGQAVDTMQTARTRARVKLLSTDFLHCVFQSLVTLYTTI